MYKCDCTLETNVFWITIHHRNFAARKFTAKLARTPRNLLPELMVVDLNLWQVVFYQFCSSALYSIADYIKLNGV